ncbi:MAG: hypothetical protein LAN18_07620 [Acidobacteriia bacterium]|nr:hypothetical protein [Terriglobia bacterium]
MSEAKNDSTAEVRLAELIWRTIKIRLTLFLLMIAAILLIWTTLETGRKQSVLFQKEFAQQEVKLLKKLATGGDASLKSIPDAALKPMQDLEQQAAISPGIFIETEKRIVRMVLPTLGNDEQSAKAHQVLQERQQALDDYDRRQQDAFQIEVSVPYLKRSVTVNALTLSDAWPFFVIAMLLVIITLGYQQKNYELILSFERTKWGTEREKARSLALAEFFGGTLVKHRDDGEDVWQYKRRLAFYPESFIMACMYLIVLYLSIQLLATYNPTLVHRTDSIFFSYYSVVWIVLVISGFLICGTRAYYRRELMDAMGAKVTSGGFSFVASTGKKINESIRAALNTRLPRYDVASFVLAGSGLILVFFRWTQPPFLLRGLGFLLNQKPLSTNSGIVFFPIDPYVFREMRIQVAFGVLFLIVCVCHSLLEMSRRPLFSRISSFIRPIRVSMGYVLLYLAGNFLLYLGILQYQSETDVSTPILDVIFSPRGMETPRGLPLLFYNPTWQFLVFLFACVALALGGKARRARPGKTSASGL